MANGEVQEILNFSLHDSKVFAILRALSGKKVMSGKLQKELTEMNRETTILCVMATWAMATLALPTPSYPSNAFSGFAEGRVCLKSRSSATTIFNDLSSFDKMVVNSTTCTKRAKRFSRVEHVERRD